jgi:hypothetical protein
MNKNTSIMAAALAVAGILTLAVMTLQHHAFAQACPNGLLVPTSAGIICVPSGCPPPTPVLTVLPSDPPNQSTGGEGSTHIAIGGGGECMSGGAGGAGGEGGQGGTNFVKDTDRKADVHQDANGGDSNGGYGGNANGGNGSTR